MKNKFESRCGHGGLGLLLCLLGFGVQAAQAADYSAGIDGAGGKALLWFRSNVNTNLAIAHYSVNGGTQQNVTMAPNGAGGRYEAALNAAAGASVRYWFTYTRDGLQYDGAPYVGALPAPMPSPSPMPAPVQNVATAPAAGVSDAGKALTVWLGVPATTAWVDLHYIQNNGAQQNLRMQAANGRRESLIAVGATDAVSLRYWFTVAVGSGAQDLPAQTWARASSGLAAPGFVPAAGLYASAQQVVLSAPGAGNRIYYTLDGSAATPSGKLYSGPIRVNGALTVNAVVVNTGGQQSPPASAAYVIDPCASAPAQCPVAAPTLSLSGGAYARPVAVALASATPGALLRYTLDGSQPSEASPHYAGPLALGAGRQYTLRAAAFKAGQRSPLVQASYSIGGGVPSRWDGTTTFNVVNGTAGAYRDDQIFWFIIGKDWDTDQYVRIDASGRAVRVAQADNRVSAPERPGELFADYNQPLSALRSLRISPIKSARLYLSVGQPVLVQIKAGGYAGPDLGNATDPNRRRLFDFGEFNIERPGSAVQGLFVNTSRVDLFGLPLRLRVQGLDGFDATVGEPLTETRAELMARYTVEVAPPFRGLATEQAPYRILAPAAGDFQPGRANAAFLDSYIGQVWNQYAAQDLTLKLDGWPAPFVGRVAGDGSFQFSDGQGQYRIAARPSTREVMLGNGVLDDAAGTRTQQQHDKQLQLQAQLCAALNRHVAHLPFAQWWDSRQFYPGGAAGNDYARFWHQHAIGALSYGFAYDDVGGHSASIYAPAPVSVTFTIGQ